MPTKKKRIKKPMPPEHGVWEHMKERCLSPNHKSYRRYGGRGITVCDEWRWSFHAFFRDMGPRPTNKHQLDRINNDGNYEPGNCRWATVEQQVQTRSNVRLISHDGETMTLASWARKYGLSEGCLFSRLDRGMSMRDALAPIPGKLSAARRMEMIRDGFMGILRDVSAINDNERDDICNRLITAIRR